MENLNKLRSQIDGVLVDTKSLISVLDYYYNLFSENMGYKRLNNAEELHQMLYVINIFSENLSEEITDVLNNTKYITRTE